MNTHHTPESLSRQLFPTNERAAEHDIDFSRSLKRFYANIIYFLQEGHYQNLSDQRIIDRCKLAIESGEIGATLADNPAFSTPAFWTTTATKVLDHLIADLHESGNKTAFHIEAYQRLVQNVIGALEINYKELQTR